MNVKPYSLWNGSQITKKVYLDYFIVKIKI